jgi:hypothetical protein
MELWNASSDPAQDVTANGLMDPRNHAGKPGVVRRFRTAVLEQLGPIRAQRRPMTDRFNRWDKLWQSKHVVQLYKGRSNVFVPRASKVIEHHVASMAVKTFPANERYTMTAIDELGEFRAEMNKRVLDHHLDESRLESRMHSFIRSALKHGTAVMKSHWEVKKTPGYKRVPVLSMADIAAGTRVPLGAPTTLVQPMDLIQYEGPRPKVVDLLRWYIHPITAETIDDYEIIFEDMDVDLNHLLAHRRSQTNPGGYIQVNKLLEMAKDGGDKGGSHDDVSNDRDDRLDAYGFRVGEPGLKTNRFKVTEIWCRFPLYEGDPRLVDCRAVVGAFGGNEPIVLSLTQNPFPNQRPPYRAWRVREMTDNFYGQGLLETLEALQYALNAFFNQALDSATYTINQSVIVDVMKLAQRHSDIRLSPLSVIPVRGDVNKAISTWAPPDVSQVAVQLAVLLGSLMEDEGNAPPITQGKLGRKLSSATEGVLLKQAGTIFEDAAIRKLESDMLTDMLRDWYMMSSHFLPPETFSRITRTPPLDDPIQAVVGDYDLRWAVSRSAETREALEMELLQAQAQMQQLQMIIAATQMQMPGTQPAAPQQGAKGPASPGGGLTGMLTG